MLQMHSWLEKRATGFNIISSFWRITSLMDGSGGCNTWSAPEWSGKAELKNPSVDEGLVDTGRPRGAVDMSRHEELSPEHLQPAVKIGVWLGYRHDVAVEPRRH